ncbi:MAG: biosynthetic arginine decarboxylase [Planctomycetota bacterium]
MTTNSDLHKWTPQDSAELYQVDAWGCGYFSVDDRGHLMVAPSTNADVQVSLLDLVQDLQHRGYPLPLLLRFSDVLHDRVRQITEAFGGAIAEESFTGRYRPVYPIKVNQQRDVVEELVRCGASVGLGLEAGSKPELLVALALCDAPDGLIICNGYKDLAYIETALLAQKLGRHPVIVLDRFDELELVLRASRRLDLRPHIGVRARLASRGAGKWAESTGPRSKFGLTAAELVRVVERLRECEMLDCLELLHFHLGSQITAIRAFKDALRESSRIFVELCAMGAPLQLIDVGGGLGVDYDGSKTNFHSSTNYSLQEYANDVVYAIREACDGRGIPHPDIVSESGRAMVAHHAVLVMDVLGTSQATRMAPPVLAGEEAAPIQELRHTYARVSRKTFQECYHDALQSREDGLQLFNLGYLDLPGRATLEGLFWAVCDRVHRIVRHLDYVPDELEGLERALADNYYCNFSVFQSLPDHWAVKQLFPIMPIHRLRERPTNRAILSDLTCDSDGRVDRFIDLHDVKDALELHEPVPGQPYYLGVFLIGAYQEILGDLHNLFGDTTAIHIRLEREHGYHVEHVVEGDTVTEVLGYVQYDRRDLMRRVRAAAERAMRNRHIRVEECALLLRRYEEGLAATTYLGPAEPATASPPPPTPNKTVLSQPEAESPH